MKLSKTDKGIVTTELCPNCNSTSIDVEPAYDDGEIIGSLFNCVECDWYKTFEEDSPEDAEEVHEVIQKDLIKIETLVDWLELFREQTVEKGRETDDHRVAQKKSNQIEMIDRLIGFFGKPESKTKSEKEGGLSG